jgi:hypothetical protein
MRMEFLNKIHNDAQKGLKYPENKNKDKVKTEDIDDDDLDIGLDMMDF